MTNQENNQKKVELKLKETVTEEKIQKKYNNKSTKTQGKAVDKDKLTLKEIVGFLEKNKEGKVSKQAYDNFIKRLNVRSYLPLETKAKILVKIIMGVVYAPEFVSEMASIDLEFRKLFHCLLAYTDMDSDSILEYPLDFSTYDIFIESGLYDYIYSICERDYKRFEKIITQAISFESVMQVNMNIAQMDPDKMGKQIEEAHAFLNQLGSKDLESLSNIATLTDPLLCDVAKMLREQQK